MRSGDLAASKRRLCARSMIGSNTIAASGKKASIVWTTTSNNFSRTRRRTMTQSSETVADKTLEITRVFDAPRELVFSVWTDAKHMAQWCAPTGFSIPLSEGDAHSGGTWHTKMVAPDGTEYSCNGEYREVTPHEKLVFSHAWDE